MRYLIWLMLISVIIVRYYYTRPVYVNGDRVRISAVVLSDPIDYPGSQYFKISGLKVYLPGKNAISYGDKVTIEGVVNVNRLDKPKFVSVNEETSPLSGIRNSIITFYQSVLPEPECGLLAGIVLGSKGALLSDFYNKTKTSGVAHVVVASGTNISFTVAFLMAVLTVFMPRKKAILFVILGCILYLFLSGFEAPLIRAVIMSSFLFLGQESGRMVNTWRIYFFTMAAMLIYKPEWIWDVGFILSFAATASLMLFEKRVRLRLMHFPEIIKEGLSTSVAAQIGVAPILYITFGRFNPLSPITNAIVLWTIPPIMILGAIGGVAGLIWPFLGKAVLYLSYPMLWWFVGVVEMF